MSVPVFLFCSFAVDLRLSVGNWSQIVLVLDIRDFKVSHSMPISYWVNPIAVRVNPKERGYPIYPQCPFRFVFFFSPQSIYAFLWDEYAEQLLANSTSVRCTLFQGLPRYAHPKVNQHKDSGPSAIRVNPNERGEPLKGALCA